MTTETAEKPEDLVRKLQEVNERLMKAGQDVDSLSDERIALMRRLRDEAKWSNVQIAESLGLTRQRVSTLLLGKG